jgi:hypothetical protein
MMANTALLRYAGHLIVSSSLTHFNSLIPVYSLRYFILKSCFFFSLWALVKELARFGSFVNKKGHCHFLFFHSVSFQQPF